MLEIVNCEQRTDEWFKTRELCMTASKADVILANSKGLETYIIELISEYLSEVKTEKYISEDMQRGIDNEPKARNIYEIEMNVDVTQVGFCKIDKHIGASPDGFVNNDGLVEIKSHKPLIFTELILFEEVSKKYVAQMQMQMYVTGRKWCDYVGFCPEIKPYIYIKRFYPDKETFKKLEKGLERGKQLITEYMERFKDETTSRFNNKQKQYIGV